MTGYYVYRFKNKDNIIVYVGRTHNLDNRFKQHKHLTDDVVKIEYIECCNEIDMVIKEIYYINLYFNENCKNIKDVYDQPVDYSFKDEWKEYNKVDKRTVFNTLDYKNYFVVRVEIFDEDMSTIKYVTHYNDCCYDFDKDDDDYIRDIKNIKYSPFLYEAELFSYKKASLIMHDLIHKQWYAEFYEERKEDFDEEKFEKEYGFLYHPQQDNTRPRFHASKFSYVYNDTQQQIFKEYLEKNNITNIQP